jgi:outer membrane protein assembly factor BamB
MIRMLLLAIVAIAFGAAARAAADGEWRQFRGNDSRAVAADAKLPLAWKAVEGENIAWHSAIPGKSASSPIVVGGKVIVTASSGVKQDRLHVLAYDAATGKELWHRQFWATGRTLCHPMSANAAPTPASDGQRVFAFFSSNDLACLDLDGNLQWYRGLAFDYPLAGNDAGMASSPVVSGGTVAVQVEAQGEAFAAGLNTHTGETRWKIDRKQLANWTSPALVRGATTEQDAFLLQSPMQLTLVDPATGRERGKLDLPCAAIASTTTGDGLFYVPANGITAVRFNDHSPNGEVVWQESRLNPTACSPVVYDHRVYTVNRTILVAADGQTGKIKWQLRLPQNKYWATPVLAGGHLYIMSYEGQGLVIKLNAAKGELISTNDFGEQILGTPAVVGDAMYVQTEKQLWKIESNVAQAKK